jgi:hypothetical protein
MQLRRADATLRLHRHTLADCRHKASGWDNRQARLEFSSAHNRPTLMSENDWNGKERRSGGDRRQTDRRNPERRPDSGILSTRESERRQTPRRKEDGQSRKQKETNE